MLILSFNTCLPTFEMFLYDEQLTLQPTVQRCIAGAQPTKSWKTWEQKTASWMESLSLPEASAVCATDVSHMEWTQLICVFFPKYLFLRLVKENSCQPNCLLVVFLGCVWQYTSSWHPGPELRCITLWAIWYTNSCGFAMEADEARTWRSLRYNQCAGWIPPETPVCRLILSSCCWGLTVTPVLSLSLSYDNAIRMAKNSSDNM